MSESLIYHYQQTESKKAAPTRAPRILKIATGITRKDLSGTELGNLQICIEPRLLNGRKTAHLEIFEMLGTSQAAAVAEALPYLRRECSARVNDWLAPINESLERLVLTGSAPAIITTPRRCLQPGNVADGNHRLLTAVMLYQRGEDISLPTFEMIISPSLWATYNAVTFARRFQSNPVGTIKVARERFKK